MEFFFKIPESFRDLTLRATSIYPGTLFFGYTSCPDFCPVTLSKLGTVRQLLGRRGAQVSTILVSVDPERDAPEKLASYPAYFDPQATGLTGTPEQIAAVAWKYGVTYQRNKAETAAGYLVDHSTYVFLLDGDHRIRYIFRHGDGPEQMARLIASLLDQWTSYLAVIHSCLSDT